MGGELPEARGLRPKIFQQPGAGILRHQGRSFIVVARRTMPSEGTREPHCDIICDVKTGLCDDLIKWGWCSDSWSHCFQSKPGEVEQAVKDAIDAGYRHIDGAFIYGNETEVGRGIRAKIAEGVVKRGDIFVTSKVGSPPRTRLRRSDQGRPPSHGLSSI